MTRSDGIYWVRRPEFGWTVAEWESGLDRWLVIGSDIHFADADFVEIGPRVGRPVHWGP